MPRKDQQNKTVQEQLISMEEHIEKMEYQRTKMLDNDEHLRRSISSLEAENGLLRAKIEELKSAIRAIVNAFIKEDKNEQH